MEEELGDCARSGKYRLVEHCVKYDTEARLLNGICCSPEINVKFEQYLVCHAFIEICSLNLWVSMSAGSDTLFCFFHEVLRQHLLTKEGSLLEGWYERDGYRVGSQPQRIGAGSTPLTYGI